MSRLLTLPGIRHYIKYRTGNDFFDRIHLRGVWGFWVGALYSIKDIHQIANEIKNDMPSMTKDKADFKDLSNIEKTFYMTMGISGNALVCGVTGFILFFL